MSINEMVEQYNPRRGGTNAHLAVILEYVEKRNAVIVASGETPRMTTMRFFERIQNNELEADLEQERTSIRMYYRELENRGQGVQWPFADWR